MDTKLYMITVDKNPAEATGIARDVAKKIETNDIKLLDVVQSLGEYLMDEDRTIRAKSISYLSSVLAHINPKLLSRQHVNVLVEFMCARLDDEVAVKEIASGLIALQGMQRFSRDDAQTVAKTILNKVDMKKHPQGTRFIVLSLVDKLMSGHRAALKASGATFVNEFTEFIQGEKDPRNLMIVFSMWRVILVEFEILQNVEEIFDAIYCYFPITFRPPPGDPYGITAQDLKQRLRDCLSSTHYFAKHIFPALIEKLDSAVLNVKRDSLQTMTACIHSYGPNSVKKHYQKIWDAVKYEVTNAMPSEGDDIVEDALNVLKALAETLGRGIETAPPAGSPLAAYIKEVTEEVLESLKEPQGKQARASTAIIAKIASAGVASHYAIVAGVVPALMVIYQDSEEIAKRKAWMDVVLFLLKASLKVYGERGNEAAAPTLENPLLQFRDRLFEIYSQALMGGGDEVSLRLTALQALNVMSRIRGFLDESDIRVIAMHLNDVLLKEEKEELRSLAIKGLLDISKFNSSLITETTFPALMAALPDTDAKAADDGVLNLENSSTSLPYPVILDSLSQLSFDDSHFSVLSTRLLNKLNVLTANAASSDYLQQILVTLYSVLEKKHSAGHVGVSKHLERIVFSLLGKTLYPLVFPESRSQVMATDGVLGMTARLSNFLIRQADAAEQEKLFAQFWKIFVAGEEADLRGHDNDSMTLMLLSPSGESIASAEKKLAETLRPYGIGATSDPTDRQAASLVIFACAFAGLRREVPLPQEPQTTSEFLNLNIRLSQDSVNASARQSHLLITALIVNKYLKSVDQDEQLKTTIKELLSSIKGISAEGEFARDYKLRILFWISKALILKGDKFATNKLLGELIGLLAMDHVGLLSARGFALLLKEDDLLNSQNYAVENKLSKQRVFSIAVPQIVENFRAAAPATKPHFLIALSSILRNVPSEYILPELSEIFPLLLQSLDISDPEVKNATINTLYVTILDSHDAAKEHLSSLITRLLAATSDREINPPRVRAAALRCLRALPGAMKSEILQPYKMNVIKGLIVALDDPKRSVRREAVDCRAKWFNVDEPEDDD